VYGRIYQLARAVFGGAREFDGLFQTLREGLA
jgi:hypothetical protein